MVIAGFYSSMVWPSFLRNQMAHVGACRGTKSLTLVGCLVASGSGIADLVSLLGCLRFQSVTLSLLYNPGTCQSFIKIWVFPKIGVPQNRWFIMENPWKTLLELMMLESFRPILGVFPPISFGFFSLIHPTCTFQEVRLLRVDDSSASPLNNHHQPLVEAFQPDDKSE